MKKLKVAVVGCGIISDRHLESAVALDEAELVAVCDIKEDRANAKAKLYDAKAYTDYKEMIDNENLDVLHIALPHYLHTEVSVYAMEKGINVICEKPMSINYNDAEYAVKCAESCGKLYGIIFQCRYNTPSIEIKKRILDGRLGPVKSATSFLTWYRPSDYYGSSDWKGTWDKEGGGVVIDQAIHSIDLTNWMISSEILSVEASLHNRNHPNMIVEDTAEGFIRYKNGVNYAFYCMNNHSVDAPIEINLVCENGSAKLSYEYADISYNDGTSERIINSSQKIVSYTGGKDYWGDQHAVQIKQFYSAVLGIEKLEISGKEALKTHKIICDIYSNNDTSINK